MNKSSFTKTQYEFAAHIRDPENNPKPADIEDRRMEIYRGLFYRNIEGFIAGGFPVLRKLYNDDHWHSMVRDFIANHQSLSPYFLEISQEFLKYLQEEHAAQDYDPPFLLELAHYEWVELALSVATDEVDMHNIDPNADLLAGRPAISPLAWLLHYQWPVHQLSPDYQPEAPPEQATYLIVYRDRQDTVRFVLLNPITACLLSNLQENPNLTGQTALQRIAEDMQHPNPQTVINGGLQALEQLKSQGIILGSYR